MKRIYYLLSIIMLSAFSSCATKSDIAGLQEQLDALKTGKIATIEQQISAIQASITSLQATDTQLSTFVNSLQLETSSIKMDISSKERALSDRISALNRYIDEELGKSRDWAKSTFATLDQYQSVLNELAGIKESVKSLDTEICAEIERAISASETSMKDWVNEQLAGYYTIAQIDAKLKAFEDTNADESARSSISKLESDLSSARADLTGAYTKAIADAISKYDGEITNRISAEIKTATDALKTRLDALDERLTKLEGMVQSLQIIPEFSNGRVKAYKDGVVIINCVISPARAVKGLSDDNFVIYATNMPGMQASYSVVKAHLPRINEGTGEVQVKADISSLLNAEDKTDAIFVALNVKSENSDFTSRFAGVTVVSGSSPSDYVDLGLSVKWATCNVGASKPEDYGGYYQWAGTKDVTDKSIYLDYSNCPYHTGSDENTGWTKYVPSGESSYWSGTGSPDNKTVLDPSDDVASVEWKGTWRMPTIAEWDELRNTSNCSWIWTKINGINGYEVWSKKSGYTDKWIFLPAAGGRFSGTLFDVGSRGGYWSSSLRTDNPSIADGVGFDYGDVRRYGSGRFRGRSVRAVFK